MQADLNSSFKKNTFLYNLDYSGSNLELLTQFVLGNIFRILALLNAFISYSLNLFPSKFRSDSLLNNFSASPGLQLIVISKEDY